MARPRPLRRRIDRLPIRWRIAGTTAGLTGLILLLFAVGIGRVTNERLRQDFAVETEQQADAVARNARLVVRPSPTGRLALQITEQTRVLAGADGIIKLFQPGGGLVATSEPGVDLGAPGSARADRGGYRVATRRFLASGDGVELPLVLQYARPTGGLERTLGLVRTFLGFGWLIGTLLALVAGAVVGRRAMQPVSELTRAARRVADTRDPSSGMPQPLVEDEVSELAETLREMLEALEAAQAHAEGTLRRQREFVADASHELRTPLTAVQANLELLAESLEGDDREAAGAALRSTRRMRRLVADLLLLARADADRGERFVRVDLDRVVLEAVLELEPQMGEHELTVDVAPLTVPGARDELVRVVLNLLGNALRHTPPGTAVAIDLRAEGDWAVLSVRDDGPGVPDAVAGRIFDRFVRGEGDGGGGTGIGLAIVRAVTHRHGGEVRHEAASAAGGTRFVVRLPLAPADGPHAVGGTARPSADAALAPAGGAPRWGEGPANGAEGAGEPVTQEIDLDVSPAAQLRRAAGRVRRRVRVRLGRPAGGDGLPAGGAASDGSAPDAEGPPAGGAAPGDARERPVAGPRAADPAARAARHRSGGR